MTEDFDEEQKLVIAEQCLEDDLIYSWKKMTNLQLKPFDRFRFTHDLILFERPERYISTFRASMTQYPLRFRGWTEKRSEGFDISGPSKSPSESDSDPYSEEYVTYYMLNTWLNMSVFPICPAFNTWWSPGSEKSRASQEE